MGQGEPSVGGRIWESDVDLVLVLDALVVGPISRKLFAAAGLSPPSQVQPARSVSRADGRETDVRLTGDTGVLLIEDKIDADFQPEQPLSYRQEADRLTADGAETRAVLVSPGRHRSRLAAVGADLFHAVVTIEELLATLDGDGDLTRACRAVLSRALEQQTTMPDDFDEVRSAWGDEYRQQVYELAPHAEFRIGESSLRRSTTGEAWFVGEEIKPLGWIGHYVEAGLVEVTRQGATIPPEALPATAKLKSRQTFRVPVPEMTFSVPPSAQTEALSAVLTTVDAMWRWLLDQGETPGQQRPVD